MLLARLLRNVVAVILVAVFLTAPAMAQKRPAPYALTAELTKAGFSGNVHVADPGRVLFRGSFGLADRTFGVPVSADTRFRVASITKLFTSALVLQLVDAGRVDLDAPFRTYLPDYPGPGADAITVRQLLGHMSGLPQFDTVRSMDEALANGLPQYQRLRTPRQLLELCCAREPVAGAGQRFDYNNADYIVLGQLIEAVTGERYEAVLDSRLLGPLGLRATGMARWDLTVPLLARTYLRPSEAAPFGNELPLFWENSYAAGGLYSTVGDVARFAEALFGGQLLRPASMEALLKPAGDDYGLGLWSYNFTRKGIRYRVAKRPGSIMGANTVIYRLLDQRVTIAVLANSNAVDLDALAQRLAEAVIDRRPIR